MHEDRTCPHCGAPFIADSDYWGRKYCSIACSYAARKSRGQVERVCETCGKTFMAKRAEVKRRGGKYCSRACYNANPPRIGSTPEAAARMRIERRAEGNPAFKGNAAGIAAAHDRVRSVRGKASDYPCVECGGVAYDWALSKGAETTYSAPRTGRKYSLRIEDYMPMCRRCHVHYDHNGTFVQYFGANAHRAPDG